MSAAASTRTIRSIELVYFNIHARGELTRLCFAAAGCLSELTDTRIPLFMESEENAREWQTVHRQRTPFGYVPYLNVVEDVPGESSGNKSRQISGDGVVDMFVARHLGLLGRDEVENSVCHTISLKAVGLLGPQLTRAGLYGQEHAIEVAVRPDGAIGEVFESLEGYVGAQLKLKGIDARQAVGDAKPFYILADKLTLADLAVYNAVDECLKGPCSQADFKSVGAVMEKHYPLLMKTYAQVAGDLKEYIQDRQNKFE